MNRSGSTCHGPNNGLNKYVSKLFVFNWTVSKKDLKKNNSEECKYERTISVILLSLCIIIPWQFEMPLKSIDKSINQICFFRKDTENFLE